MEQSGLDLYWSIERKGKICQKRRRSWTVEVKQALETNDVFSNTIAYQPYGWVEYVISIIGAHEGELEC